MKFNFTLPLVSSALHSLTTKSTTAIRDQYNNLIELPQKWADDLKHLEFNELLSSSIGPLALYFGWKRKQKEEFSELASGTLTTSFVYGEPVTSLTAIVVLAYRYSKSKNSSELRNLKWGIVKGGISAGAFALTIKGMGLSVLSFLVGTCAVFAIRKSASFLRFYEYMRFLKNLRIKFPKFKKELSRRDFLKLKLFTYSYTN
mgnify:FL=1